MKQTIKKTLLAVFLVLWGAGAVYGYFQATDSGSKLKTVTIAYQKGDPIDLAIQHGELSKKMKAQGYKVVYRQFTDGSAEMQALAAGSVDYARTGDTPPVTAQAAGTSIAYIAAGGTREKGSAIVVGKNSSIKSVKDLKGKKVAYTQGTSSQYFLLKSLENAGMDANDVTWVNMKQPDASIAFGRGKVDAWVTWDPYTAQAQIVQNANILIDGSGSSKNREFLLSTQKYAKANKTVSAYLLQYLQEDMTWADTHRSDVINLYTKSLNMKKSVVKKMVDRKPFSMTAITNQIITEQQNIADTFFDQGLINKKVDVKNAVVKVTK